MDNDALNRTVPDTCSESYGWLLPESDEHTICIRFDGFISKEAYDVFMNQLHIVRARSAPFNVVMSFCEHKGWDEQAAAESFDSFLRHAKFAHRIAYVNPPEGKIKHIQLFKTWVEGEIRIFNEEAYSEAVAWAKGSD